MMRSWPLRNRLAFAGPISIGFEAVGVDRSAAKRNNNKFLQVHAELADVAHLAPFHALTLFEVLEHLDAPLDLLVSLGSWVAPGGVLVLEVPDCSGINTISTRDEYLKVHPLEHINAFTPKTLAYLAARAGFRPITKPVSIVTSDGKGCLKGLGKYAKAALRKATTQQYFRKL